MFLLFTAVNSPVSVVLVVFVAIVVIVVTVVTIATILLNMYLVPFLIAIVETISLILSNVHSHSDSFFFH